MTYKTTAERAHDVLLDRAIAAEKERDEAIQRASDAIDAANQALEVVEERDRTIAVLRMGFRTSEQIQAAQGAITASSEGVES